jgi:hypothetical protein
MSSGSKKAAVFLFIYPDKKTGEKEEKNGR